MRMVKCLAISAGLMLGGDPLRAEVVYDQITTGSITVTSPPFACNVGPCTPCVRTSPVNGPVIAFGQTGFNGAEAWGTVTGTFTASVLLDGVSVPASLLPSGSRFRSQVTLRHSFCRGFSGNDPCPGYACGVTYQIGSVSRSVVRTGATFPVEFPASEAVGGSFRFDFCNHDIVWGAGCDRAGSIGNRWFLVTPNPVRAAALPAGDATPVSFANLGLTVDKSSGSGGTLTATRVQGQLPVGALALFPDYPSYWELTSNLAPNSFEAEIQLRYDPAAIRPGVVEQSLKVWRVDLATGQCTGMTTTIDPVTHTAIATGVTGFATFYLSATSPPTATRKQSWGGVKTLYR